MTFLRNLIVCLILAATGAYVLWQFHTVYGLASGLVCLGLMLCIAFPTEIKPGVQTFRANVVLVVPTIMDAMKGGDRRTDPPKDGAS